MSWQCQGLEKVNTFNDNRRLYYNYSPPFPSGLQVNPSETPMSLLSDMGS